MPLEDEQKPKQPVEFDQAINYVNKIKVGAMRWCTQRSLPGTTARFFSRKTVYQKPDASPAHTADTFQQ